MVTITINGANDAAVITGTATGAVTEAGGVNNGTPGIPTATGDLNSTDVDNPSDAWTAAGAATASGYGSYTLTAAGVWAYTLNNSNAAVQALNVGDTLTDTFTAMTVGSTAQVVTITINGANDAAVITGPVTGTVVEAGGVNNGTPGTPFAVGNLNSTDVDNPSDAWDVVATSLRGASGYGSYTVTATGVWAYTLDNNNATVQALNAGGTLTDTFTAFTVDGTAQVVTITINGANDAAVITGTATGAVTEAGGVNNGSPGTPTATGDLNSTDVDNAADAWTAVGTATASASGYGSYHAHRRRRLDLHARQQQCRGAGAQCRRHADRHLHRPHGRRHRAARHHHHQRRQRCGGDHRRLQRVGNRGRRCQQRHAGHPNRDRQSELHRRRQPERRLDRGRHGDRKRQWLRQLHADRRRGLDLHAQQQQCRGAGAQCRADADRHLHRHHGRRHRATRHHHHQRRQRRRGDHRDRDRSRDRGRRSQQRQPGTPTATGDLNSTDVDNPNDAWTAVGAATASASGYGSYTLTAAGVWTYTLNNSNAAVQALNAGGTLTDTFTVTTVDGTAQLVTITIHGANDAAVITGTATGTVVEAGGVNNGTPGTPTATGDLNSTDVDNPNDAWTAVSGPAASTSGYGSYTLTATGVWTYTLDNSNATVQALNVGGTLTDTFTVATVDGTAQLVTITINGANDAAVISGAATGAGDRGRRRQQRQPGTPIATGNLVSTDVDNPNDAWTAVSAPVVSANGFGSYTLTAAGVWTYTLDNSNAAVQALNVGQTLTDTFTATTVDGTAQLVTITINGANDAAVITGTATGAVTEAGGVNNGTPGTPIAVGNLNSTDVDNPNDAWNAVGTSLRGDNGYGSYTLTAAGIWIYTLDNSNAAVQALNAGQTLTDTFTASTVDGTEQLVTITINGTNDAAVITGTATGAVTEAGGVNNGSLGTPTATGNLNSTDVDNTAEPGRAVSTATASASGFGSYTLTAAASGPTRSTTATRPCRRSMRPISLTDSFTVTTVDGTAQLVTITINGANDAAVITGTASGSVTEAGGVANGTPGIPIATGDLTSTDVDNPNDAWTAVNTATASANGYGSYTLTAAGVWAYTLDNSNPAVQALGTGDTLPDSFTVTTIDGTLQVVSITINGTDDAAVISGDFTGTVLEAGGVANGTPGIPTATGDLDAADVDNPPGWTPVGTPPRATMATAATR